MNVIGIEAVNNVKNVFVGAVRRVTLQGNGMQSGDKITFVPEGADCKAVKVTDANVFTVEDGAAEMTFAAPGGQLPVLLQVRRDGVPRDDGAGVHAGDPGQRGAVEDGVREPLPERGDRDGQRRVGERQGGVHGGHVRGGDVHGGAPDPQRVRRGDGDVRGDGREPARVLLVRRHGAAAADGGGERARGAADDGGEAAAAADGEVPAGGHGA